MTSTPATQAVAELSAPGGVLDLGHDRARLAIRMLRLLAQEGRPAARDHALRSVIEWGVERATATALLDAWTERNDDGEIVGLGLTYNPTPHEMTIDGVRMWAWCAMDTLIFTHILDEPVTISSTAPGSGTGSGDAVRLRASPAGITDLHPAGAVATQRVPRLRPGSRAFTVQEITDPPDKPCLNSRARIGGKKATPRSIRCWDR